MTHGMGLRLDEEATNNWCLRPYSKCVESVKIIRVKIILHLAMTVIGSVALAALEVKTFDWHTTSMAVCRKQRIVE